ncbi:MAG: hypothetical protein IJX22_05145 [Opitutales bacterium]|nr:hypothetical protein [Opitutales bacterium]
MDADDYAQVNVGEHSAEAALNNPETYGSDWVEEAPASFPITVSYRNAGGPYRLSVTVTVKRSLREIYFETELNTPDELNHVPAYSQEALTKKRQERLCFGCGEIARVKVRNKKTKKDFSEFPDRCWNDAALDKDNKFCAGTNCFPENGETKRECYLSADFSDGEIITIDFTVKYPTHETAQEISEADLVVFLKTENPRITDEEIEKLLIGKNEAYYGGLYYAVTVHPTDVSFRRLWFWENEHPEEKSGLFLDNGIDTVHKPHDPVMLNKYNIWTDSAWFGVTISDEKILNAEKDENWIVGKLTWSCPVRWSMAYENNTNTNTQNTTLPHDGKISGRVQHMELQRQLFPPLIKVRVSKEFNVSKIL